MELRNSRRGKSRIGVRRGSNFVKMCHFEGPTPFPVFIRRWAQMSVTDRRGALFLDQVNMSILMTAPFFNFRQICIMILNGFIKILFVEKTAT